MLDDQMHDQPRPGFSVVNEGAPCCVELMDAGGRPLVSLVIQATSTEDLVLRVIPAIRAQLSIGVPLFFRQRALDATEAAALAAAQGH
jgi:hypothetical protein